MGIIFVWMNFPENPEKLFHSSKSHLTSTSISNTESHPPYTSSISSTTGTSTSNAGLEQPPLLCPRSIWGYGYVYPNETLTLLVYSSIDYIKNTTFVDLYLGNISISYTTSDVLSMANSSGIAGYVPLPLYLKFQTPERQFSILGNDALSLQIWNKRKILNETGINIWLHFQVAALKPTEVHLKFKSYSSLYISYRKGEDTFEYTTRLTNLYNTSILLENVSFPLALIQKYPKPPDIEVVNFNLMNMTSNRTLEQLPPNSTALLKVLVKVPSNVDGLYFKPKLMFKIGNESLAVPGPPMEYVRAEDCA